MNTSLKLRQLLNGDKSIVVPGVHDPMSAKIFQDSGFDVLFAGGFSLSASTLGVPDIGLLTMSENIERVKRITSHIDIPLIADIYNDDSVDIIVRNDDFISIYSNQGINLLKI